MGNLFGGGRKDPAPVQQTPTQVITPARDQVLSPGQRMVDDMLSYYTSRQIQAYQPSAYFQATQLYPLSNYQATHMPQFNPQAYRSMYGQTGYGPQNLNSVKPFNFNAGGNPYNPSQGGQPPMFGGK